MSRCGRALEGHVLAVEQDAPDGRQLEAGDHAQASSSCRSPRARAGEELAVLDDESRVLHGDEIAEGLVQILDRGSRAIVSLIRKLVTMTNIDRAGEDRDERIGVERQPERLASA